MTREQRMGQEVGYVAGKIAAAVECSTCGIGIAVEMVGQRWGEPSYDWKGQRFGHDCKLTRVGLDPKQVAAVDVIEKQLEKWAHTQRGGDYQATMADTRLPVEAR